MREPATKWDSRANGIKERGARGGADEWEPDVMRLPDADADDDRPML